MTIFSSMSIAYESRPKLSKFEYEYFETGVFFSDITKRIAFVLDANRIKGTPAE